MKNGVFAQQHRVIVILLGIYLALALMGLSSGAQERASKAGSISVVDPGHVTILILDMSGSMSSNDPQAVRCSAADAYIDLSRHGDEIGVIALTSGNESAGGSQHAQVWQEPNPVDVMAEREKLKQSIENRPTGTPSCQQPFGNTPTYDALSQALRMLNNATRGNDLQGSVILLSDGQPYPNTQRQIQDIENNLLPQFQQHHWLIDTIALGIQQDFRLFLKTIASRTGGTAYDDAQGSVPGQPSPLNITPFFITIFSERIGSTLSPVIPSSSLNNSTTAYNFTLDSYTQHLDIVVVKEQGISTTLTGPPPEMLALPSKIPLPGIFVVTDNPYYEIFSIDGPKAGVWQLDLSGTGRFLVDSLVASWLQVAILSPSQDGMLLPLGQQFLLKATLTDARNPGVPQAKSDLNPVATITYQSTASSSSPPFTTRQYSMPWADGIYQTNVIIPSTAWEGTYTISVAINGETSAVISSATRTICMAHFPEPLFPGNIIEQRLDSWMQYDPVVGWFGLAPSAEVSGNIQINGITYGHASVSNAVLYSKSGEQIPLHVSNDRYGGFQLRIPTLPSGTYTVVLTINGTFQELSGRLITVERTVHLTTAPPSWIIYTMVILVSALLALALLIILVSLVWGWRRVTGPAPFGECILKRNNESYRYSFNKAQRRFRVAIWRNTLYSEKVPVDFWKGDMPQEVKRMPPGLKLCFCRDGTIKVTRYGYEGKYWWQKDQNGEKELSKCSCKEKNLELVYRPMSGNAPLIFSELTIRPRVQ